MEAAAAITLLCDVDRIKEGFDYSAFKRYCIDRSAMPESMLQRMSNDPEAGGLDFKKVLPIDFPDSKSEVGLQIVDILLAAFCRALNGIWLNGEGNARTMMTNTPRSRNRVISACSQMTSSERAMPACVRDVLPKN